MKFINDMILSKKIAQKKLRRMAMEIAERNHDKDSLILIGIKENGMVIAQKIAGYLKDVFQGNIQLISLSMDKKNPSEIMLSEWPDFNAATVILIDDVANSGRTMLYAIKPLLEQYPKSIQTLALVERTHKQFPVQVDYVGHSVSTTRDEMIIVEVSGGEVEGAFLN
jgi:pyrimidine operon attenuation protein / uracil phosphoribosyltransferase